MSALIPLALLLVLSPPAAAQNRVLVVPEGTSVVVPPRGVAPGTRVAELPRRPRQRLAPREAAPAEAAPAEVAVSPLLALVPLAAAAALAATLPGSGGGGGSGPVRTR